MKKYLLLIFFSVLTALCFAQKPTTTFNSKYHLSGKLIVFFKNGDSDFAKCKTNLALNKISVKWQSLNSKKDYLVIVPNDSTQYYFNWFTQKGFNVSFDEFALPDGDGVIAVTDPQISTYESDIYGGASVDEDSLRAFLKPSLRNSEDDADETVKLVMTELADPIYSGGELPMIDTPNSINHHLNPQNFSYPVDNHGPFVVSGAVAKANGLQMIGTSNVGRYISQNYKNELGLYSAGGYIACLNWAINYLNANPSKSLIINKSHGGYGSNTNIANAYTTLFNLNRCIIVHAAGNSNVNVESWEQSQNLPFYLSVGNSDAVGNKSPSSNWGSWVDVYFQGTNVFGLNIGGSASQSSGTSFSCPRVAGIVNKIWNAVGGPARIGASQLCDMFRNNTRLMVVQPDNTTKPIAHGFDIMMRLVNHMEESHPAPFNATTEPTVDLKQWTRTAWFPQMINVQYYIKVGATYQLLPNGILNTTQFCSGNYEFKIVWDNNGVPGANGQNTTTTIGRYKQIINTTPTVLTASQSTNTTSVCAGANGNVVFTVTGNAPAGSTYKLKENSTVLFTTTASSFTFNMGSLSAGVHNVYTEVTPPNGGCYTTTFVNSNTSAITVNANQTLTASITATATNICSGTSVTFTVASNATSANYQWKKNGVNVGTNAVTYTDNSLVNGNTISCVVTATGGCFTTTNATSNTISMVVNSPVTPAINITASRTNPCVGETVTFTATATNGGTTPNYQWQKNGLNVATGSTYNTSTLTNGDVVSCILTTSLTCVTATTSTSNTITPTVRPVLTPTASIIASNTTICANTSVNFTATTNIVNPVYKWQVNGINAGSNVNTYSSATLNNNDVVRCVITAPATDCYTVYVVTTNGITITVKPLLTPTIQIASSDNDNILCEGQAVTFTATITNGGTTPVYQWRKNGVNTGRNSPSYTLSNPSNGDIISCILVSNEQCLTANNIVSNSITNEVITVNPNISASNGYNLTASPIRSGATWQWYKDGQVIQGATGSSCTALLYGDYTVMETYKTCTKLSQLYKVLPVTIQSDADIKLYPNPVNNTLFIVSKSSVIVITALNVHDMTGKLLVSKAVGNQNIVPLNVEALPAGMYVIEVVTNGKTSKLKFIKQ